MSRREFWHKHLFLKQMLPCKSAEERPAQVEQWTILGNRGTMILQGLQTLFGAVLKLTNDFVCGGSTFWRASWG